MTGSKRGGGWTFGRIVTVAAATLGGIAGAAVISCSVHPSAGGQEDADLSRLAFDPAARSAAKAFLEG